MSKVKEHRKTHLVDLANFNQMQQKENVYILDTRSKEMYDRKHVKGAIHINFSDFTQENLDALFPSRDANILIYCNNNFIESVQIDPTSSQIRMIADMNFASKVSRPDMREFQIQTIDRGSIPNAVFQMNSGWTIETIEVEEAIEDRAENIESEKPITLALNIPTYINLYGYGYRNVFELSELVYTNDPRIQFEGTEVDTAGLRND